MLSTRLLLAGDDVQRKRLSIKGLCDWIIGEGSLLGSWNMGLGEVGDFDGAGRY